MKQATVTDAEAKHLETHGYVVLQTHLPPQTLDTLRQEADLAIGWQEEQLRAGRPAEALNHLGEHYFIPRRSQARPALNAFVLGSFMSEICRRLVGPDAFLFSELFVCKMAHCRVPFGWHQDTGYIHAFGFPEFPPNITVWTALDDITAENGALRVRSFADGAPRRVVAHHEDEFRNQIADFGPGPETVLEVPAGSVTILSGLLPHRSGANATTAPRRAHLTQYGAKPLLQPDGSPVHLAVEVLRNGVGLHP